MAHGKIYHESSPKRKGRLANDKGRKEDTALQGKGRPGSGEHTGIECSGKQARPVTV